MSRGPLAFKATDVTRIIRAVAAAGVRASKVVVTKSGQIVVVLAPTDQDQPQSPDCNEWMTDDKN